MTRIVRPLDVTEGTQSRLMRPMRELLSKVQRRSYRSSPHTQRKKPVNSGAEEHWVGPWVFETASQIRDVKCRVIRYIKRGELKVQMA